MNRFLLLTLLLLPAMSVVAQTPVFKIEDNTGTALLLVNDDGTITLPTGATNGYVLTTDANGNAAWMPAGSGGSLTLPFAGTTASTSPAFSVENTGTGRGLEATAQAGPALWASASASEGLRVSQAGTRGVFVASSSQEAFGAQFVGGDGVSIFRAGSPSTTTDSPLNNGFEVDGAEGYGLFVGRADVDGVRVESANFDGLRVASSGSAGVRVESAINGIVASSVVDQGVWVEAAGGEGVRVESAGSDGVHVFKAGNALMLSSSENNGFQVDGAEGHGLYVGWTGEDGVHVESAGNRAGYFNGDVEITGELSAGPNGVKMPIAYGTVDHLGNIVTASPNVTNVTRSGLGTYLITVQGETASLNHVVMVTAINTAILQPTASAIFSTFFSPEFTVFTLDGSGSGVNRAFSFVIYKP